MEPYLSEIIPRLLVNLSDKMEKVNNSANVLLNLLVQRYGGDKLLEYFINMLDVKEDIVVIGAALEVLSTQLIKSTDQYFKDKLNIKKIVKKLGRLIYDYSSDKTISMPGLGSLLALRDIEMNRTIKSLMSLPSQQLDIIKDLSDSYAPDLSSNLASTNESDATRQFSNSSNYGNNPRKMKKLKSQEVDLKPMINNPNYPDYNMVKTTPYFHEYDQVMQQKDAEVPISTVKDSLSNGRSHKFYDDNDIHQFDDQIENDQCIDCVSYYKRMSVGLHSKDNIHKVTSKSKPYYIHILIEHYNDEETIIQIVDDLLESKDGAHNATELLLIISDLIIKEEPPILQALIKTEKYIISKCNSYELTPILKEITDPLVTTFNHPHANVRKSVVFGLVELYFAIGDAFESCLEELNPSQQKLV